MSVQLQPARIATFQTGEQGLLVWADGQLMAVLVHLSDAYGENAGKWHLEAAFGRVAHPSAGIFADLDKAQAWIEERLRQVA